jgi:proteic killer suppression protein
LRGEIYANPLETQVKFEFSSSKIRRLYLEEFGARKYPPEVVDAFFEVMAVIDAAESEQDLRNLKHLRFEKLKGPRKHQRSLRLHGGFRIVVQLVTDEQGTYLLVEDIENYH